MAMAMKGMPLCSLTFNCVVSWFHTWWIIWQFLQGMIRTFVCALCLLLVTGVDSATGCLKHKCMVSLFNKRALYPLQLDVHSFLGHILVLQENGRDQAPIR